MQRDIFPDRSQVAAELLRSQPSSSVLIVPVDFAKREHVAQICSGTGEFLFQRPIIARNDAPGAAYLIERIEACCRRLGVPRSHVLVGGEDAPSYARNFLTALAAAGLHLLRVQPADAKRYRTNTRATTDKLALNGIAQAILCRRSYDLERLGGLYSTMKGAERTRRRLVWQETAAKNRIHRQVEWLFPGFLSQAQSGLLPFGSASLELMGEDFSVVHIRRLRTETLVRRLKQASVQHPAEAAEKLKALAGKTLAPPAEAIAYGSRSLALQVGLLRGLQGAMKAEENEMARCLAQTPGFLLTSIPGIGVVLAGGLVAEYGDPDHWPDPDRMASYGGIVPRHYQTGGPDAQGITGSLPLDCNHHLKDWLLQAAFHAGTTPHEAWDRMALPGDQHRLYEHYQRVELQEGHSRLSTAKLLLRIGRAMVRDRRAYLPANALDPQAQDALSPEALVQYLGLTAAAVARRWRGYDLSGLPEELNLLQQWHKEIEALTQFHARGTTL